MSNKKYNFHKDMTLDQVIQACPHARGILMGFGMHCFGCPVSHMETLEEASYVHDIELDFLLKKLDELNEMDLPEMVYDNYNDFFNE